MASAHLHDCSFRTGNTVAECRYLALTADRNVLLENRQAASSIVFRMHILLAQDLYRVKYHWQNRLEILDCRFLAARQIYNQGLAADSSHGARQPCVRRFR